MTNDHERNFIPEEPNKPLATQPAMKRSKPHNTYIGISTHENPIIAVYSPSGGSGKTTIATNVAVALKRPGERVLLVDCALESGDVGVFLNLQARNSLIDLIHDPKSFLPEIEDPDPEWPGDTLVKHKSGVEVLLAPDYRKDARPVDVEALSGVIKRLPNSFNFVVLDMSVNRDTLNRALLTLADHVLLVANPTLPSVKNIRAALSLFDSQNCNPDKVHLVFNLVDAQLERRKVCIPVNAIQANVRKTALGVIPRDNDRVLWAMNRGIPVVDWYPKESPAKDLIALANAIYALCRGAGQSAP